MSRFIDERRERFGVEPMCRTLGVSGSACYHRKAPGRHLAVVDRVHRLDCVCRPDHARARATEAEREFYAAPSRGDKVAEARYRQVVLRTYRALGLTRHERWFAADTKDPINRAA